MIKFYYNLAPNPTKVALFLEESGLPYEPIPVDTRKGDQHAPAFRAINRYLFEAKRHYGILDAQLAKHRYLLGDAYTIADMDVWGGGRASCRMSWATMR